MSATLSSAFASTLVAQLSKIACARQWSVSKISFCDGVSYSMADRAANLTGLLVYVRILNDHIDDITYFPALHQLIEELLPKHITLRCRSFALKTSHDGGWTHVKLCMSCFRTNKREKFHRCIVCAHASWLLQAADKMSVCIIWLWRHTHTELIEDVKAHIERKLCVLSMYSLPK